MTSRDVTLRIDGTEVTVPAGTNLIEAAKAGGGSVPHYCYHPRMSVAGNCRICLVEVEGWPKLTIACNTGATDGMVVHTGSEKVKSAREMVMELLLINHPLDCTICDQAGECKLQDYAVDHGSGVTRFEFDKVRKPKNVTWGDKVVFDSERCILCTCCVRFLDEVVGTDEVGIDMRGDKVTLIVKGDGNLTSPYQMNIIDLCPVGALTSRDFRFKSRVWFMQFSSTVCTSCARGCNVVAGTRHERMLRMVPRYNPDVNDYWMCDHGRLSYAFVNDEERIVQPRVEGKPAPYPVALDRAAAILGGGGAESAACVASAFMTNEELHALAGLCDRLGIEERYVLVPIGEGDDMLVHPEKAPNARGAEVLGFVRAPADWGEREWDLLVDFVPREGIALPDSVLGAAKRRVCFSLHENGADVCFPLTTWVEKDGTVISAGDRLQRLSKGMTYEPMLLTERAVLDSLHASLDGEYKGADTAAQAFARLAASQPALNGVTWQDVGLMGVTLRMQQEVTA